VRSEGQLERSDSKSIVPISYLMNNLPFVASFLASPLFQTLFVIRFAHRRPTSLVGKKIAPIYSFEQDDLVMGESMDIIKKIDGDER